MANSAPPDAAESFALLQTAFNLGIRVFDTAPAYAASECRLGEFLSQLAPSHRSDLIIMTKVGEHWDEARGASFVDHSPDALRRSIDRSIDILGRIDVLQIHKATREVVAHPDVMAALRHGQDRGITCFGASVSDVEAAHAALETGLYGALQFPLNLANRTMLAIVPLLNEANVCAIVNRPFAMGSLIADADAGEQARTAFRFIQQCIGRGIVLTGTGNSAHLASNVEAFRSSAALASPDG